LAPTWLNLSQGILYGQASKQKLHLYPSNSPKQEPRAGGTPTQNPLEFSPFGSKPQEMHPNNRLCPFGRIPPLTQPTPPSPSTTPGQSRANVPIQAKHPSSFGHLSARHKTTQTGGDADLIFTNIFIVIVFLRLKNFPARVK